jgi:O-antigen/teichoic acid export membrane protein
MALLKSLAGRFAGVDPGRVAQLSSALVGIYNGVLSLALLPYQVVLAVAFVVFPLISRSTFEQDRDSSKSYIEGTLRYSTLFVGAVVVSILVAPETLLAVLNPSFSVGGDALRVYAAGELFFALFAIANTIIVASGRMGVAALLAAGTLLVDVVANLLVVPLFLRIEGDAFSPVALTAAASATAPVFALAYVASLVFLNRAFGARPPLGTLAKVVGFGGLIAVGAAFLPRMGLVLSLALAVVAPVVYLAGMIALRALGRGDLERLRAVVSRRRPT